MEKQFGNELRVGFSDSEMSFKHVDSGLKAEFDAQLLQKYLPQTSGVIGGDKILVNSLGRVIPDVTREALENTEFIGVYGRVIRGGPSGTTCLQYIYLFDYQAVPAHEADYEPVFVFLNNSGKNAIYDLIHYCTRKIQLSSQEPGPGLMMVPGWHSFLPAQKIEPASLDKGLRVQPLSDQHLDTWWSIPDEEARLKIDEYMRNPFHIKSPGHFLRNPDENAQTICCSFLEFEKALSEFDNPRTAIVEGVKRAFSKCVGILALYRLGAFIQLLNEMDQVGLIQLSASLENLGLGNITAFLQDGFLSLTKAGQDFFGRMRSYSD